MSGWRWSLHFMLYTSEYVNIFFILKCCIFFDRRIIGQMRRNLEQAASSLPNQWPPLTPCPSLQGSARSPTRPVPARPVTACLMTTPTTHCLPLQPNLGPIGKWYFCSSSLKIRGQGRISFGLYFELWKWKTSYIYVSIGSRSSLNVKGKLTSMRILQFVFIWGKFTCSAYIPVIVLFLQ